MTEMKDPVRLQIGGSQDVQSLLRSAMVDAPSRVQLDRLASRLAPVVTAAPAAGILGSIAPWLVAATVVIGGVAGVWWARDREPTAHVQVTAPARIATPAAVPARQPTHTDVRQVAPAVVMPSAIAADPTRKQPHNLAPVAPTHEPPVDTPKPREMDLLGPAHQALGGGNFIEALELATRHRDLYSSGVMTEEREAIAIEALAKLGERDSARTRFGQFSVNFPRSGYRARLTRMLTEQKP